MKKHFRVLPGLEAPEPELIAVEPVKAKRRKKVRPFRRGTRQYLVFEGPWASAKIHPVIRSSSGTFLGLRLPKLVAIDHMQMAEYRRAVNR